MAQVFHLAWPCLRALLSVVLLYVALGKIDWLALFQNRQTIQPAWLLLALLAVFMANLLSGLRWSWLLRRAAVSETQVRHVGLYFAGALINQGVPTLIGGDAFRTLQVSVPASRRQAVLVLIVDRFLGLMGNTQLGAIGLAGAGMLLGGWLSLLGYLLLFVTLMFFAVADVLLRVQRCRLWLDWLCERFKVPCALAPIRAAFAWPGGLFQAGLGFLIHLLTLLALEFCLLAFDVHPPFPILMVWMSMISLLLVLPVSVSGWGVRETALASTLAYWGVAPGISVLASICYGAITLIALLPGLPWLLRGRVSQSSREDV